MKVNNTDIVEDMTIALGISISLADIQQILSIILLCFNIVWLFLKLSIKIYKYYKNDGKIDKNEWEDILNDEKEIEEKFKGGDK